MTKWWTESFVFYWKTSRKCLHNDKKSNYLFGAFSHSLGWRPQWICWCWYSLSCLPHSHSTDNNTVCHSSWDFVRNCQIFFLYLLRFTPLIFLCNRATFKSQSSSNWLMVLYSHQWSKLHELLFAFKVCHVGKTSHLFSTTFASGERYVLLECFETHFHKEFDQKQKKKLKTARALARCDEGFGLSNLSKSFQDVSRVAAKSRRVDRRRQFSVAQLAPLMKTIVAQGALWVQTLWGSVEINWSEAEGQMFDKHSEVCVALKARHLSSRLRVQIHSPLLTGIEWHECVFTNAWPKRAAVRIRRVLGLLRAQFCEG